MAQADSFINQDIKVTVDAIVFGYNQENGISVLLIKRKIMPHINEWALPGGFVLNHETLEQAVELSTSSSLSSTRVEAPTLQTIAIDFNTFYL